MNARLAPGYFFAATGIVAAGVSASFRPILGVSFLITVAAALALNGARGAVASIRVRPVDADDPLSPAAVVRTLHNIIRGHLLFLGAMASTYAIVAVRADHRPVELFAITFALAALFAGPFTSVRRREGLWTAAGVVAVGLVVWTVGWGRV
jgi:hypothetical protein